MLSGHFCLPNHSAAVIAHVVNTTLKPYTYSAAATDKCPQCSYFHMKAETEQKAIPAVYARSSPAVDSGSGCIHQLSSGKASAARTSNASELLAFWSREMRICLCLSLHHPCSSPTLTVEWGKSSDTPVHSGFCQHTPKPTLCSPFMCGCMHHRGRAAFLFACCSADILYCCTCACLSDEFCLHVLTYGKPP